MKYRAEIDGLRAFTLMVNGTFRSTMKNHKKLFRTFAIAFLNNVGYSMNWKIFLKFNLN
tara:strand:+ start:254 stop:430 length:177 start_codon:yes stop_codon:yes gene_type:complete